MSNVVSVISRVAAVLFFIAIGAGAYGYVAHNNLKAVERRLVDTQQEQATLKNELIQTEKTMLANSSVVRTCAVERETYKTRAQSAEAALSELKSPKTAKPSRSSL